MVRPVESEADLQRVNEMQDSELRYEFIEQVREIRKKIFKKIRPKLLLGKSINGSMLVEIC